MERINLDKIDIQKRPIKILQFGSGNFLRGFTDWMVQEMNEKTDFNGNVHIVQTHSKSIPEDFNRQKNLYHVVIRGYAKGKILDEPKLINSISGISNPFLDFEAYLSLAELPDLAFIVSNTTESGIKWDPEDKKGPHKLSQTFPGNLTSLLYHRFLHFKADPGKGLVFFPCELIEENGNQLKECILQYASLWKLPKEFIHWVEVSNSFYNTLVDRIVPGYPKESADEVLSKLCFEDKLAVVSEPYHLWVIERPKELEEIFPTKKAGLNVVYVDNLMPYRTQKVRILNGAHTALVPIAYLSGFRTVRESVENEKIGSFIRQVIFSEIIPTLDMPKEDVEKFAHDVLERFRNPFIRHELISISLNSISKFRVRVLPTILAYYEKFHEWPSGLIRSFASLIIFYRGEFKGENIPLKDDETILLFFEQVWKKNLDTLGAVTSILGNKQLWGMDLTNLEGLSKVIEEEMVHIQGKKN
jgi:tagaturonate reductase